MTTFERSTVVDAPFERTWDFHSTVDGLRELTPSAAGLRVHEIRWPEGSTDDTLTEGAEVTLSIAPLGVVSLGPWTSRIVERREREDRAVFVDEMVDGPADMWRHEHHVAALDGGERSRVTDRVTLRTGFGGLADRLAAASLRPVFWDRHRRTRAALAGD